MNVLIELNMLGGGGWRDGKRSFSITRSIKQGKYRATSYNYLFYMFAVNYQRKDKFPYFSILINFEQ